MNFRPSLTAIALLLFLGVLRREAQQPLLDVHNDSDELFHLAKQVRKAAAWRGKGREPRYGTWAQQAIKGPLDEFIEASRMDLSELSQLHAFRIAGKRLRYSVELLACHCKTEDRKTVERFATRIQTRLGNVNDHAAASGLLAQWADRPDASAALKRDLQRLSLLEMQHALHGQQTFLQWWDERRARSVKKAVRKMYSAVE